MGTSNESARRWWSGREDEGVAPGYGGRVLVELRRNGVQGCQCLREEQGKGCDKGEYCRQIMCHSASEVRDSEVPVIRSNPSSVTVCFFVLCKRHWFNRVPGAHRGDSLHLPSALTRTLAMPSYF